MENRDQTVKEYFELIVYLNKANPTKNARTEIAFGIREATEPGYKLELYCYLKGLSDPAILILCRSMRTGVWNSANYTKFYAVEDFCREELNGAPIDWKIDVHPTQITELMLKIKAQLRGLGIEK